MTELWNWIAPFVTPEKMLGLLRSTILLVVGFVVGKLLSRFGVPTQLGETGTSDGKDNRTAGLAEFHDPL